MEFFCSQYPDHIASGGRITHEWKWWFTNGLDGSGRGLIEVLFRNFPEETKDKDEIADPPA
jgi:hypothetical protein